MMLKNADLSNILLNFTSSILIRAELHLGVDAPQDLSIIRPTSGADETENSLVINELDEVSSEERFGSDA